MTRYRAVLAYDGTAYFGFQRQAGTTPTVQGAVETALRAVCGAPVSIVGAGRTDTGVHARGQVIAFDVAAWRHGPAALRRATNAHLPGDVALQSVDEAAADFHPRYDARSRCYEYTLYIATTRHPLLDRYAWQVRTQGALDGAALHDAAARLVGERDFATFGRPPQGTNTVRHVLRSAFIDLPPGPITSGIVRYQIEANAFLTRMVRRIVGALVRVGLGQITPDELAAALVAADEQWPNQAAPARGLCLLDIRYR